MPLLLQIPTELKLLMALVQLLVCKDFIYKLIKVGAPLALLEQQLLMEIQQDQPAQLALLVISVLPRHQL